jgi:hypothetical protein
MSPRRISAAAALFALCATWASAAAATSPPALPDWLAGCWDGEGKSAGVTEAWSNGRIGQMLGIGATLRGSRSNFEFMRIDTAADASLQFVAQPGGRPPVRFTATVVEPNRIVFSNPRHDAPKMIEYRRAGDQLLVSLDAAPGAEPSFRFRRVSCDALFAPR